MEKFTLYRFDGRNGNRKVFALDAGKLMERMKTENRYHDVTKWRACVSHAHPERGEKPQYRYLERLHMVVPALHLARCGDGTVWQTKHYNGIVLLSAGPFGLEKLERVKKIAAMIPQTMAAFMGAGGDTLKILVPFVRPDGTLPQTEEEYRLFHAHAFRKALLRYHPLLRCTLQPSSGSPFAAFRMSYDEDFFFNPRAVPIVMEQPVEPCGTLELPAEWEKPPVASSKDCLGELPQKIPKMVQNVLKLGDFLLQRYVFRYNTLLNVTEFHPRGTGEEVFAVFDRNVRNSIALDAFEEGLEILDRDVDRFLGSDRVPRFNPVEEYLRHTGPWDGTDRIRRLAACVPTAQQGWPDFFYRWFLSMVAQWMGLDRQHGNSATPLLIGAQGTRKSTFCRRILPPELRFGYTESLDMGNRREAELALSRFLLINLDEYDQIGLRQQPFLKNLLQKPYANLRRPYARSVEEMRRYASFIATSNHDDLLSDSSGARRYICVRVSGTIDVDTPIDYLQLYAQAQAALRNGERWWFDAREEAALTLQNREFERVSPMEQTFLQAFGVPAMQDEGEWFTSEQLLQVLHRDWHLPLSDTNRVGLGRIMKKLSVPSVRTKLGMRYRVVRVAHPAE